MIARMETNAQIDQVSVIWRFPRRAERVKNSFCIIVYVRASALARNEDVSAPISRIRAETLLRHQLKLSHFFPRASILRQNIDRIFAAHHGAPHSIYAGRRRR